MKSVVLSFLALCLSYSAYAGSAQLQAADKGENRELSFAQFKQSCLNPAQFQSQRAPQGIKVICGDNRLAWLPSQQQQLQIKGHRMIRAQMLSDKYHVKSDEHEVGLAPTIGSCPIYREVKQTLNVEKNVTCDDIVSFKGTLKDFCANVLDETVKESAELMQVEETGRVMDACKPRITEALK